MTTAHTVSGFDLSKIPSSTYPLKDILEPVHPYIGQLVLGVDEESVYSGPYPQARSIFPGCSRREAATPSSPLFVDHAHENVLGVEVVPTAYSSRQSW